MEEARLNAEVASQPLNDFLCCTRCGERQETYSEIVYSQGDRVCLDCKKETQESDNHAFDRDMSYRTFET